MKKIPAWLIIFTLHTLPLIAQAKAKTITYEVRVYAWSFTKSVWYVDRVIKKITELYDSADRLLTEIIDNSEGKTIEKTFFSYSKESWQKTTYDSNGQLLRVATLKKEGKWVRETVADACGQVLFYLLTLFNQGNEPLEQEYRDHKDKLIFRRRFYYDRDGKLMRIDHFNSAKTLAVQINYRYETFTSDGQWTARSEFYSYADVKNRPHEIVFRKIIEE